jgi:hypothetical protein
MITTLNTANRRVTPCATLLPPVSNGLINIGADGYLLAKVNK